MYRITSYKTRGYYYFTQPSNAGFIYQKTLHFYFIKLLELRVFFEGGSYKRKYSIPHIRQIHSTFLYMYRVQGLKLMHFRIQTNNFSWLNDIIFKNFCFINLTWPPRPQKAKVPNFLPNLGVALLSFPIQEADCWGFQMRQFVFVLGLVLSVS